VTGYQEIAHLLYELEAWIFGELAAGVPPKWVAQRAGDAVWEIAGQARLWHDFTIAP
jgi:hypothetical protein